MSREILRSLGALALLVALGAPAALATEVQGPQNQPTQACDDQPATYSAPAGSTTAQGNSSGRAKRNAQNDAAQAVGQSVAACDTCPDGDECLFGWHYEWDNNEASEPVWDATLGKWVCTVTWDGCKVTQTCKSC